MMHRQNRLKGTGQEAQYSGDRYIHKIISELFTKDNPHQDTYICSILKKSNGMMLLDNAITALLQIQQHKHNQVWDSHTLGGLIGVLEFCGFTDEDPESFLKSLKEGETVTNRIMSVINADSNLMRDLDLSPDLKTKIDERIQFIDDQLEDIKMIDELINRIKAVKSADANKKNSAKSQSIFSKL